MTDTIVPDSGAAAGELTKYYFRVAGSQSDQFCRQLPALLEGPAQTWQASRDLINFGTLLLELSGRVATSSDEEKVREFAYLALLRRALITTEAAWQLLAKGLLEPALTQIRTLLDVRLNINLIAADKTARMATRLGAYHYLHNQRHGQKAVADRDTVAHAMDPEFRGYMIDVAKSYARHLESPVFDGVRDELKSARLWHGHDSVEAAFRAAGDASDYFMSYDSFTAFVHASNIDHDFVDDGNGAPALRPVAERNPSRVQMVLAFLTFQFLEILRVLVAARGLPPELSEEEARRHVIASGAELADADPVVVDDFTGIQRHVLKAFSATPFSPPGTL